MILHLRAKGRGHLRRQFYHFPYVCANCLCVTAGPWTPELKDGTNTVPTPWIIASSIRGVPGNKLKQHSCFKSTGNHSWWCLFPLMASRNAIAWANGISFANYHKTYNICVFSLLTWQNKSHIQCKWRKWRVTLITEERKAYISYPIISLTFLHFSHHMGWMLAQAVKFEFWIPVLPRKGYFTTAWAVLLFFWPSFFF